MSEGIAKDTCNGECGCDKVPGARCEDDKNRKPTSKDVERNLVTNLEKAVTLKPETDCVMLQQTVFDLIRCIIDPEKPDNLEDLNVVSEQDVHIQKREEDEYHIRIEFIPTVPHCSLAPLIGLCMRSKLEKCLVEKHKLDIFIKAGTHATADEINKQINDKERIAAAMENPNLRKIVEKCIEENY